ncbi:25 kDa protein [Cowpea mottle virus]|nr:25 kDa protein [Cowpea mottle virus]AAC54602.1 ORF1; Method: conceptual translation supplied by author [Cowpea mottle virus]prf//2123377A ORF 1 [Cowpea mottle virus]
MLIQFGTMPPVEVQGPPRVTPWSSPSAIGKFLVGVCGGLGDAWADTVTRNRTTHINAFERFGEFPIEWAINSTGDEVFEPERPTREVGKGKRVINRHAKGYFLKEAVTACRLQFNGVPMSTNANLLGVRKFLAGFCQEHGLTNQQSLRLVNAATPLVMTANQEDVEYMKLFNCVQLNEKRAEYLDAQVVHTPIRQLVARPLSGEKWSQWIAHLGGFRPATGFRVSN